ncbi:hypothetical protein Sjap_018514 [Stephania japonica]|uniref:Uncharacterized protein n=1 Tax=Stephania japonica TaxID=461633 RepID=A0AAP0NL76_9MAGN
MISTAHTTDIVIIGYEKVLFLPIFIPLIKKLYKNSLIPTHIYRERESLKVRLI